MLRRLRHIWFVVALIAVGGVAFVLGPHRPTSEAVARAELISDLEGKAHARWVSIKRSSGETWEPAEVVRIEQQVLPPWRKARRLVEDARSGLMADHFPPAMAEFFRLRNESWTALVRAVRENDERLFDRHAELFEEAERVGADLKQRRKAAWQRSGSNGGREMRLDGQIIPAADPDTIRREIPGGAELIDEIDRLVRDGDPHEKLRGLREILKPMWGMAKQWKRPG